MRRIAPPLLFALLTATAAQARAADLAGLALDTSGLQCGDAAIAARIEDGDRLVINGPRDRLIAAEWIEHGIDVVLTSPEGDIDSAPAGYAREPLLLRTDAQGRAEQPIAVTYRRPWARAALAGRCLDDDEVEAIRLQERRIGLARTLSAMRRAMGQRAAPRLGLLTLTQAISLWLQTAPESAERLWTLMQLDRLGSFTERAVWRLPWLAEARRIGESTGDRVAWVAASMETLSYASWPSVEQADDELVPIAEEARRLGMADVEARAESTRCRRRSHAVADGANVDCYDGVTARYRAMGAADEEAHAHLNRFTARSANGRVAELEISLSAAEGLAVRSTDLRLLSRVALYRGAQIWGQGRFEAAFAELGRSLDLARLSGYRVPAAATERYLGHVYAMAGQPRRALHHLEAARATALDLGNLALAAEIGAGSARILARLGEHEAAQSQFGESIRILGDSGRLYMQTRARLRLAETLARRGRLAEAQAQIDAVPKTESPGSWAVQARRSIVQAELWIRNGRSEEAASVLRPLLDDSLSFGGLDLTLEAAALLQEAELRQSDESAQRQLSERMLALGLPLAARVRFPMLRDELLARLEPFAMSGLWVAHSGGLAEARVSELLAPIERVRELERAPLPQPDRDSELDALEQILAQGSDAQSLDASRQARLLALIGQSSERPAPDAARRGEVLLTTPSRGDVLLYLIHSRHLSGVMVGDAAGWRWERFAEASTIEEAKGDLVRLLSSGHADMQRVERATQALEVALGWPLGLQTPPDRLRVVVDAPLADIPWGLLAAPGGGRPLAETTQIELLQSLAAESGTAPATSGPIYALGAAQPGGALSNLESVSNELASIADAWGSAATVTHTQATRSVLSEALAAPGALVHVAAHGRGDRGLFEDAGLWLMDEQALAPVFVSALRLRTSKVNASLIVLASCESGGSESVRAAGMGGVAGALVDAGATTVVGTRWPVGDRAAARFSSLFHEQLAAQPDAPSAALRHAVTELRRDKSTRHPSHWAGWFALRRGPQTRAPSAAPAIAER